MNVNRAKVYASPYQPELVQHGEVYELNANMFRFCDWAFPYFRNQDRYNPVHQCTPDAVPIAKNPVPDFPAIDVMMTHGPPLGILDAVESGEHVGCGHLLRAARRCKPKLHCFGHIHEGWGAQLVRWKVGNELGVKTEQHVESIVEVDVDVEKMKADRAASVELGVRAGEETLMVNASIMTVSYKPWNGPWIVDLDLEKAKERST